MKENNNHHNKENHESKYNLIDFYEERTSFSNYNQTHFEMNNTNNLLIGFDNFTDIMDQSFSFLNVFQDQINSKNKVLNGLYCEEILDNDEDDIEDF